MKPETLLYAVALAAVVLACCVTVGAPADKKVPRREPTGPFPQDACARRNPSMARRVRSSRLPHWPPSWRQCKRAAFALARHMDRAGPTSEPTGAIASSAIRASAAKQSLAIVNGASAEANLGSTTHFGPRGWMC